MSNFCDYTRHSFLFFLVLLLDTNARSPWFASSITTALCTGSAAAADFPAGAGETRQLTDIQNAEKEFEQERIERRKADVADKILKAIGLTKPPEVKEQDRERFRPLIDQLLSQHDLGLGVQRNTHKAEEPRLTKKKVFLPLKTDSRTQKFLQDSRIQEFVQELLQDSISKAQKETSFLGGLFSIQNHEIKGFEVSNGEIILTFPNDIRSICPSVMFTNSWNSESVTIDLSHQTGTLRIPLDNSYFYGMQEKREKEVMLQVLCMNGTHITKQPPEVNSPNFSAFLSMSLVSYRSIRARRELVVRCKDQPKHLHGRCCLEEFEINFSDMGYGFVIAPETVKINRCRGTCSYRDPHMMANFSALLRALSPAGTAGAPRFHCCAPSRFSSMSIFYKDENSGGATQRNIPDTIVENCNCI